MSHGEVVPMTIRNQRYRGWPIILLAIWVVFWLGAAILLRMLGLKSVGTVLPAALFLVVLTVVGVLLMLDRWPVKHIRLGDDLVAIPTACFRAEDIAVIAFAHDPDEDYIEDKLPTRLKQVTIQHRRGRKIRLIVNIDDSRRLRAWAETKGVSVVDPD